MKFSRPRASWEARDELAAPNQRSVTAELAEYVATVPFEDLPEEFLERTKLHTLDAIGCAVLGARAQVAPAIESTFGRFGVSDEATVWGTGRRTSAYAAAIANASMIHLTELAEGVGRAAVHPSSTVAPGVFSIAEREGVTGEAAMRALALATEVIIRFGITMATNPSDPRHAEKKGDGAVSIIQGWQTPVLLSAVGSATAAGLVLGQSAATLHHSWGIACNMSPATVLMTFTEGVSAKGPFMGVGCGAGLIAADLASEGVTGTIDIVGGWMPVLVPACDPSKLVEGLGTHFELDERSMFKWFATLGPMIPAMEATLDIVANHGPLDPDQIEKIHVESYRRAITVPGYDAPTSSEGAKANLPHCLATAILFPARELFLHEAFQPQMYENPAVRTLAGRVTGEVTSEFEDLYPHHAAAGRVTITMTDGSTFSSTANRNAIPRYHRPTRDDIAGKFHAATRGRLSEDDADAAIDAVWRLEELPSVTELTRHLRLNGRE